MMPNVNEMFPGKFLKAPDLHGQAVNLVIARYTQERLGNDLCWVLYFQGHTKGLVLKPTNAHALAAVYGPELDGWIGKPMQLYPTMTTFKGQPTSCLRIRVLPSQQPIAAALSTVPPPIPPELDGLEVDMDGDGEEILF